MKLWLEVRFTTLHIVGAVSTVFSAADVECGIIISKPSPGSALGSKLSNKMSQFIPSSRSSKHNTASNVSGKVRLDESKPIKLVPVEG